ncbi:MAG: hypothetical protein HYV96_14385 [Opitutae bacterium]|nr:hypothetical protein [Opitutae bacterium]
MTPRVEKNWLLKFPIWWGLAAYAVLLLWLWPRWNCVHNGDEFGYYENLALTARSGHWVSSHWLEPLNRPLVYGGWALFTLTGSFYIATLGLTYLFAVGNYVLLERLLRSQFPMGAWRAVAVWGISACPLLLNKTIEYTGYTVSVFTLLAALLAWQKRRLGWFCGLVLLGFTSRQSGLFLLILPLADLWVRRRWEWRPIAAVATCGLLALWLLQQTTPTLAWQIATTKMAQTTPWQAACRTLGGVLTIIAGWTLWDTVLHGGAIERVRRNLRAPWIPGALSLCMVALGWRHGFEIDIGTPAFQSLAGLAPYSAGMLLWLVDWTRLPALPAWGFLVLYCGAVAVRGKWWEHYLVDPWLVLIVFTSPRSADAPATPNWRRVGLGYAALLSFLLYAVVLHHGRMKVQARVASYEMELRTGARVLPEMAGTSFGLKGWKLFAALRPDPRGNLIDFLHYVPTRASAGRVRSEYPTGELWLLPPGYANRRFPLTDAEWREFIREKS